MSAALFNAITLIGLWLFVLAVSVLAASFIASEQYDIAEVIPAQSNVGLSIGFARAGTH